MPRYSIVNSFLDTVYKHNRQREIEATTLKSMASIVRRSSTMRGAGHYRNEEDALPKEVFQALSDQEKATIRRCGRQRRRIRRRCRNRIHAHQYVSGSRSRSRSSGEGTICSHDRRHHLEPNKGDRDSTRLHDRETRKRKQTQDTSKVSLRITGSNDQNAGESRTERLSKRGGICCMDASSTGRPLRKNTTRSPWAPTIPYKANGCML